VTISEETWTAAPGIIDPFGFRPVHPFVKRTLWSLLVLSPVVWALFHEPGAEVVPADASLPRPSPKRISMLRTDPLDDASRAEGESALRCILGRWQTEDERRARVRGACGNYPSGRFCCEWYFGTREVRLLALGYPEVAEAWAQRTAEAPMDTRNRGRAITALGILARERWGGAEGVLVRLLRNPGDRLRSQVFSQLIDTDLKAHSRLIRNLAREGLDAAVEALAEFTDAETGEMLEKARVNPSNLPSLQGPNHYAATAALERRAVLGSRRWEEMAKETILEQTTRWGTNHFDWAVRTALKRGAPWLPATLRLRVEGEYASDRIRVEWGGLRVSSCVAEDCLVALEELGAPLTEPEQGYLRRNGYRGDPRERLAEVLRDPGF